MGAVLMEVLKLLALDALFIGICLLAIVPLAFYKRAAFAVMKRNFVGYFSNPTGYVFLCLFVLLTSLAAFWPHEFFTANLANLDQLNKVLPFIMLIFVPAITMSIWSEEKRLGTDELLLTLPADDFDIVMGKYLSAAAIFTASLIFSQLANYSVLVALTLGGLDTGLFFSTYLGYWLVGLCMLAVGMVASFITSNMTVGFILGVAFNAPLAFGAKADVIVHPDFARQVAQWGLASQFDDLGRGVVSLSSVSYFVLLAVFGLYICMVLIGARHWSGGRDGDSMIWHYVVRAAALLVGIIAVVMFVSNYDVLRVDTTLGKVSSLSPKTQQIIRELDPQYPITIHAFVSAHVPEQYVQTKFNLISLLREFDAISGNKIDVQLHVNLETFGEEALLAEQRFGIRPTMVRTRNRGAFKDEEVILGAAFSSGLEKVVVPFFDYGIPVEYELIRSIGTVSQEKRKKVGIVRTEAQLMGGFSFAGGMPRQIPKSEIILELEKQYDVEEVDPTNPIADGQFDVLIVVQPSSLGPDELNNVVDIVRRGQPTALFEDPLPSMAEMSQVPGTGAPKQAPGGGGMAGMFGGGGQPLPKGDIRALWNLIGIDPPAQPNFQGGVNPDVVWQEYLPYLKLQVQGIPDQWVFVSNDAPGADGSLNPENPITAGLSEILFPIPGAIEVASNSDMDFTPLVKTSAIAGRMPLEDFRTNQMDPDRLKAVQGRPSGDQILAARIQGVADEAPPSNIDATDTGEESTPSERPIDVVYVADIDLMISAFMRLRARPDDDQEINWRFENVNFLLNVVDVLSGDDEYVEIRRRKPHHSTLKVVEQRAQQKRDEEFTQRLDYEKEFNDAVSKAEDDNKNAIKKFEDRLNELKSGQASGKVKLQDFTAAAQAFNIEQTRLAKRLDVTREQLTRDRDEGIEKIRRETDLEIAKIQRSIKLWAVFLPPIPPLLVGLVVFVRRRLREREGIAKSRLK
jgi:ABC-2 type transport system permease protein